MINIVSFLLCHPSLISLIKHIIKFYLLNLFVNKNCTFEVEGERLKVVFMNLYKNDHLF